MTVNWIQEFADDHKKVGQYHAKTEEAAEGFASYLRMCGIEFWISD